MSLSLYEQETIINYNQGEMVATIFTYSKSLISRVEKLRKRLPDEVALLREEKTGAREYRVPKSCIDIKIPPKFSEEVLGRKRRSMEAASKKLRQEATESEQSQYPEISKIGAPGIDVIEAPTPIHPDGV